MLAFIFVYWRDYHLPINIAFKLHSECSPLVRLCRQCGDAWAEVG